VSGLRAAQAAEELPGLPALDVPEVPARAPFLRGRLVTRCGSCGAAIFWAKTQIGKRIPIDLEPRADGNLVVRRAQAGVVAVPLAKAGELGPDEVLHVSHFATCPDAPAHRGVR
jgi:hypothetical protein